MNTLPEEIINEILIIVDKPSLFYASQVCGQWRGLSLKLVKIIKVEDDFIASCSLGDRLSIIKSKINRGWLNYGLHGACYGGHKEIVELLITKGADYWNCGLYTACRGGHKEIVELLIDKGADYWDGGLYAACRGGHKELVELMIAKGAASCLCGKHINKH